MAQAHVVISGYVQGVGFRHFIRKKAQSLGLTGWVSNTQGGKVEALFQGSREAIEDMIAHCKKGPFLAEVKNVTASWQEEVEKHKSFENVV